MFIGRQRELKKLNELYEQNNFECAVIYGRRRVGKTTLINEFIKEKESVFFTGLESNARENLSALSGEILSLNRILAEDSVTGAVFPDYKSALETVFYMARERRFVFVIDEYPYLANAYKGISSLLQQMIDRLHQTSKLFLILCGSSLSFMENQVLGYQSPLYGRRTAQFSIKPFDFFESFNFFPRFSPEERAVAYGVTGGIPQYMLKFNDRLPLERNITDNFFQPDSYLFEEPANLIKQECREPAQYNAIIKAIATGASRLSEIASKVDLETGLCSNYLTTLMSLGIIKKEFPFKEETSKKTVYLINDSMFRFHYRFVPDNMSLIQNNQPHRVWQRVAPQLSAYMGGVFEEICKQWLWRENVNERLPVFFSELGRWWGNDPVRKREAEIDIVAFADNDNAIFCECKWINEKADISVLDSLVKRSELFRYRNKYLFLFSKTGFTDGCESKAAELGNVRLVCFSEMNEF